MLFVVGAGLHDQLTSLPWNEIPVAHTTSDRGPGRVEQREIQVGTIQAGIGFPHARQAIRLVRRTRRIGQKKWRIETYYAVTDLTADQATPTDLAAWIRGHWSIENKLHCSPTSPTARTTPNPAPATVPETWQASATSRSTSSA